MRHKRPHFHWFHPHDLRRSLIFRGQQPLELSEFQKGYWIGIGTQKTYDLIPHMTYFHWFYMLTSGGHWYLEVKCLQNHLRSNGVWEWNRNTKKKPMIWYLTWLIFIDLIFWPPEVSKFYRSRPPWSIRMESEHKKPLIWYLTWLIIIHGGQSGGQWPPISNLWRWPNLEAVCKISAFYINY